MWVRTAVVCLAILGPGCASLPGRPSHNRITPEDLLSGAALGVGAEASVADGNQGVLAVSDEMKAFLDRHVSPGANRTSRLRQLGAAVMRSTDFKLAYDETTRTARATFETGRGNCLSFSNMFVAMAREVQLQAVFQEVDTPPDWSFRDDTFVLNRHVNVLLDLGREGEHVVDFNMEDFRTAYDRRRISDARALAHHHNNVGVEHMQSGDVAASLHALRRAIESDPSFSPAWTNLGILYMREGRIAHAEAAQLRALQADPADLVAMNNLAGLYARLGEPELAARYRRRVARYRDGNPYYRFQLAREAVRVEDYDTAIAHLREAIRAKQNEDRFYYWLGLSYVKKGDAREGRRWLAHAVQVAGTDVSKRRYASKIGLLLSPSGRESTVEAERP